MGKFSETCATFFVIGTLSVACYPSISNEATFRQDVALSKLEDIGSLPNVVSVDLQLHSSAPTPGDQHDGIECDCQDEEALYTKLIRKFIDMKVLTGKDEFLSQIQVQKVCGSDGKLYRGGCDFECARQKNTGLSKAGRAHCRRNNQHKNSDKANNQNRNAETTRVEMSEKLTMPEDTKFQFEEGPKQEHPKVCICPRNYYPVCASNGVTYGNKCAFNCAKTNLYKDMTIVTLGAKCNPEDETVIKK